MTSKPMRLNKYIAACGVASRRRADELIREGEVRVNGKTITELGTLINPDKDNIFVCNKPLKTSQEKVYLIFNKPAQVVTTMTDPEGRPCIQDYLKKSRIRVFPVGRLDWDTEGLLLLTNDGQFAQKVTHPKFHVTKTYVAKLDGQPTDAQLEKLKRGVTIIGGRTSALYAAKVPGLGSDKYDWIKIIITEGRNRQVRQMFAKIGYDVKKLQRVAIGALSLGTTERGELRLLMPDDLKKIFLKPKELRHEETKKKVVRSNKSRYPGRRLHKRIK